MHGFDSMGAEMFKKWQAKIMEEALSSSRYGGGYGEHAHHHHHHNGNGFANGNGYNNGNGYANGARLIERDFSSGKHGSKTMVEEIMEDEVMHGSRHLPLEWRNKADVTKPQVHSGVITRTASSRWSEAEVQVVVPAGSTIMGDILIQLKVRPTD